MHFFTHFTPPSLPAAYPYSCCCGECAQADLQHPNRSKPVNCETGNSSENLSLRIGVSVGYWRWSKEVTRSHSRGFLPHTPFSVFTSLIRLHGLRNGLFIRTVLVYGLLVKRHCKQGRATSRPELATIVWNEITQILCAFTVQLNDCLGKQIKSR